MYKMGYFQEVAEPIFFPLLTQFSFVRIIPPERGREHDYRRCGQNTVEIDA